MASLLLKASYTSELTSGFNYINLENGLLNLETMELEPHNNKTFTTVQLPISYDPQAECLKYINFLDDVFENDKLLIKLFQEVMGYCISYSTKAQKFFILLGDGSNGKSVVCAILAALCGEKNVSGVSLRNFSKQFSKATLVDKLLNLSTENELAGDSLNTEELKAISSGDLIQVERKYLDPYSVKLYTKLMFSVNKLPYSKDTSYGITRRLLIIPFNKKYVRKPINESQGEIDVNLEETLLGELSGILNFALLGLQRLRRNNYMFSSSIKSEAILEEYKVEINSYLDFVQSSIELADPKDKIERLFIKDILKSFQVWADNNNQVQLNNVSIKRLLKEIRLSLRNLNMPFSEGKSNGNQYFSGIKLTDYMKNLIKTSMKNRN